MDFLTLEEKWTNHPPNLESLKVFGCIGCVPQNQGKLKARVIKWMFLGFTKGVKGYMWYPTEKRCMTSQDVIFKEDETFMTKESSYWSSNSKTPCTSIEVENLNGPQSINQSNIESTSEEHEPTILEEGEKVKCETSCEIEDHLRDYALARDRQRMNITPSSRYGEANYISTTQNDVSSINDT